MYLCTCIYAPLVHTIPHVDMSKPLTFKSSQAGAYESSMQPNCLMILKIVNSCVLNFNYNQYPDVRKGCNWLHYQHTIQVIHCQKKITVSTEWCRASHMNVPLISWTVSQKHCYMFLLRSANNIQMVSVQKQQGVMNCGVFAIVMMTSIAFLQHLLQCYVDQKMIPRN